MTEYEQKRLQAIREKMLKFKAQEKAILVKDKTRQRKERTRRLIQLGALAEKYFNCKDITPTDFEKLLQQHLAIIKA